MRTPLFALAVALALALGGESPARAACSLAKIAELPVVLTNHQPLVTAKINGQDVRFLADSGAFFSFLSPSAAIKFKLRVTSLPDELRVEGLGGDIDSGLATVPKFTLDQMDLKDVDFVVGGREAGPNLVGLLGQNVLRLADVEYDLGGGMIRLIRARDCQGADLAYWAGDKGYSTLRMLRGDTVGRLTIGMVKVNGVELQALFDTGAQVSMVSRLAATKAGLRVGGPGVVPAGKAFGGGGRAVQTWVAPVTSLEIGGEKIANTKLRIGEFSLERIEMILGADFFKSHRVYVANSQGRVFFTYQGGPVFDLSGRGEGGTGTGTASR